MQLPECTDGHVAKTRQMLGGTVAHYYVTKEDGPDAFNPTEVDPTYTDRMWQAIKLLGVFNICPVAS